MKSRYRIRRPAPGLAADLHGDDGIDPRHDRSRASRRPDRADRKTLQLCKEAARTLQATLAGECADPLLNELEVTGVAPGRHANALCVTVRSTGIPPRGNEQEILARLSAVAGFLRAQIASAVVRRRAPELRFTVLPSLGGDA